MKCQSKRRLLAIAVMLIVASTVTSAEVHGDPIPTNHKDAIASPTASMLPMEPRGEDNGLNLNAVEGKSKPSSMYAIESSAANPVISGPTSKVAVVYSEADPVGMDKLGKLTKPSAEERKMPQGGKTKTTPEEQKNWRTLKVSSGDSYLNALDHSHASNDPREGVVRVNPRPKMSRPIRREYHEGPVYRPSGDQYGVPKEPSSTYGGSGNNDNHAANDFARISYGGPESFPSTPNDAYSLPVQSSVNFNDNRYGPPQTSYGAPPQTSYGAPPQPETSYGAPTVLKIFKSSYGPPSSFPQNSYGPPSNIYPTGGTNQQGYKPASTAYGAPYAIQDYSQHVPSLPNIGFSWPIALKLNAFTLAKILLKLVLFKMIVKFIAVICLLLFIPKLEIIKKGDKDDVDDDEGRGLLESDSALERLNNLTALVTRSIEKYEREAGNLDEECTNISCRLRKFITFDQSWNDYGRLFKSYVAEETSNDAAKITVTNHLNS